MKTSTLPAWPLAALLVAITLIAYWPAVGYEFVGVDDPEFVTENARVRQGLTGDGVRWAFTESHASNWIPLTWVSLMLDAQGTTEPQARRFHRTNVLLHAVTTLLVFVSFLLLTGARWTSLLVAALFALHPLRVESVAWVAERKDVLSGVFWFGCLAAYARYVQVRGKLWYLATAGLLALGLLAKAMLVTVPAVLLLLDAWPLRRTESWRARVIEKLPLLGLALASSVLTFLAQRGGGAVSNLERLGIAERLANAAVAYARYVQMTLWPDELSYLYLHPSLRQQGGGWPLWLVLACLGGLVAVSVALVRIAQTRDVRHPLVGWLWYLGTLVPVIGVVQVGNQSVADRYTYIPQVGLWIVLAWSLKHVAEKRSALRWPVVGLACLVLAGCVVKGRQQLPVWRDSQSLFAHASQLDDRNYYALNGLGTCLARAGDTRGAVRSLERALEVRPTMSEAMVNLGNVHYMQRQFDAAVRRYREALQYEPDSIQAHLNLANCYLVQNRLDEAQHHYEATLQRAPDSWQAHASLGRIYAVRNQWDRAVEALQRAVSLRPSDSKLRGQLQEAMRRRG